MGPPSLPPSLPRGPNKTFGRREKQLWRDATREEKRKTDGMWRGEGGTTWFATSQRQSPLPRCLCGGGPFAFHHLPDRLMRSTYYAAAAAVGIPVQRRRRRIYMGEVTVAEEEKKNVTSYL